MTDVVATATGGTHTNYGVFNYGSAPTMSAMTATATGDDNSFGVYNLSSSPTIRNSSISGSTNSINNEDSKTKVADTTLDGKVAGDGFTCVGAHTSAYVALDTSCT
jgi:hypothetical protein